MFSNLIFFSQSGEKLWCNIIMILVHFTMSGKLYWNILILVHFTMRMNIFSNVLTILIFVKFILSIFQLGYLVFSFCFFLFFFLWYWGLNSGLTVARQALLPFRSHHQPGFFLVCFCTSGSCCLMFWKHFYLFIISFDVIYWFAYLLTYRKFKILCYQIICIFSL
jgi:hypothetical protein